MERCYAQARPCFHFLTAERSFLIPPVHHFVHQLENDNPNVLQFSDRRPSLQPRTVQTVADIEVARSARLKSRCDAMVNRKSCRCQHEIARLHLPIQDT